MPSSAHDRSNGLAKRPIRASFVSARDECRAKTLTATEMVVSPAIRTEAFLIPDELITKRMISMASLPRQPGETVTFIWTATEAETLTSDTAFTCKTYVGPTGFTRWTPILAATIMAIQFQMPESLIPAPKTVRAVLTMTDHEEGKTTELAAWDGVGNGTRVVQLDGTNSSLFTLPADPTKISLSATITMPSGSIVAEGHAAQVRVMLSYDDHVSVPAGTTTYGQGSGSLFTGGGGGGASYPELDEFGKVDASVIPLDSINAGHLVPNSVGQSEISSGGVGVHELAAGSVTDEKVRFSGGSLSSVPACENSVLVSSAVLGSGSGTNVVSRTFSASEDVAEMLEFFMVFFDKGDQRFSGWVSGVFMVNHKGTNVVHGVKTRDGDVSKMQGPIALSDVVFSTYHTSTTAFLKVSIPTVPADREYKIGYRGWWNVMV